MTDYTALADGVARHCWFKRTKDRGNHDYPFAEHLRDCDICQAEAALRRAAALERAAALMKEIALSGVEIDHPGMRYVVVQIDRVTWDELRQRVKELDDD